MRTSTGTRAAVEEMLGNNELVSRLADVKAVDEVSEFEPALLSLLYFPLGTHSESVSADAGQRSASHMLRAVSCNQCERAASDRKSPHY